MASEQGKTPRKLSGLDKAVIVMLNLERPVLAKVFKRLSAGEVAHIFRHFETEFSERQFTQNHFMAVAREFLKLARRDSSNHLKEAIALAFGDHAFDQIVRWDSWRAIADRIKPGALASLLANERPQTVAIVLGQLPARYAADVVAELPKELAAKAIERLAYAEGVSGATLDAIFQAIEDNLGGQVQVGATGKGEGVQRAAGVLNQLDSEKANEIVAAIRQADPDCAAAIEQEMFHFEDLLRLDNRSLQLVLGSCEPARLAVALKGLSPDKTATVFGALSEQAAQVVKEEMEAIGPVPLREVQAARRELINYALQLEREGKVYVRVRDQLVT